MIDGKWIEGLTPAMPVADAARAVLSARFAVVRHYLPLAAEKPGESAEHVHQLRVGTRRAAAALRVFKEALPRKLLKRTKGSLRRIRRAAGGARDWDVFLLSLPGARPLSTATAKPALDFLLGYAFGERAAAQADLVEAASEAGPLFAEQSEKLPARARGPRGGDEAPPANFGELAARQLGELLRAFTADAEANPTEPHALHALRIAGKRLRYAIEVFAPCFPPALRETVYPMVERVQELLGDVQDAAVGAGRLAGIEENVKAVMPKQFVRVKRGTDALAKSLRARVPAGRKAFAAWRAEWLELVKGLSLGVIAATNAAPA
jgi:CHAD domain-containing protein